jgi:hypothetical protein
MKTALAYTVIAEIDDEAVAAEYLAWLVDGHLAEVRAGGALEASVVRVKSAKAKFEVRYLFADAAAFAAYEAGPAIALRADSAARFPPSRGVRQSRWLGEQLARV